MKSLLFPPGVALTVNIVVCASPTFGNETLLNGILVAGPSPDPPPPRPKLSEFRNSTVFESLYF